MYRYLSQDDSDTEAAATSLLDLGISPAPSSTPPGPAPPGFGYSQDSSGNWTLTPIIAGQTQTVEEGASLVQPPSAPAAIISSVQPTPTPAAAAVSPAAAVGLPTGGVTPTQIAPGVYVNPQAVTAGSQVVQTASGALQVVPAGTAAPAASVPVGTSTLDYWLSQKTGGVPNQYIFFGGIFFGAAILLLSMKKKR